MRISRNHLDALQVDVNLEHRLMMADIGTGAEFDIPDDVGATKVSLDIKVEGLQGANRDLFFAATQVDFGPQDGDLDGIHVGPQMVDGRNQTNYGGYFREFTNGKDRYAPIYDKGPEVVDENQFSGDQLYNIDKNVPTRPVRVSHFDPGTYLQVNRTVASRDGFRWKEDTTYKMTVSRQGKQDGFWKYNATIKEKGSGGKAFDLGNIYTQSDRIIGMPTFTETHRDENDPLKYRVTFSNPKYFAKGREFDAEFQGVPSTSGKNNAVYAPSKRAFEESQTLVHSNGYGVPKTAYKSVTKTDRQWDEPAE